MSEAIRLWTGTAPGTPAGFSGEADYSGDFFGATGIRMIRNVSVPTLTPYLPDPDVATGTVVIVAPGGGFQFLSWEHEGAEVAAWLQQRGIAAFLLKYRLADTGPTDDEFRAAMAAWFARMTDTGQLKPVQVGAIAPGAEKLAHADGRRAVRLVRERAEEWQVDPQRVGVLGFSAGAFVASATAFSEDPQERASFVAPIYGGAVLGEFDDRTPPLFSVVAADDVLCLDACLSSFQAWRSAGKPAELHVYEKGGHGFGTRKLGLPIDGWLDRFAEWLESHRW